MRGSYYNWNESRSTLEMFNFPAIFIANGTAILLLLVVLFSAKKTLRHALFEEKVFYLGSTERISC